MLELAEIVIAMTKTLSTIIFEPRPEEDPVRRYSDITVAKAALQWEPTVSLIAGFERTIDYFRQRWFSQNHRLLTPRESLPCVGVDRRNCVKGEMQ